MTDEIEKNLRLLSGDRAQGRTALSDAEKDELVVAVGGPGTTLNIRQAMKTLPHERIPFLFSSLNPQLVADIMANDMSEAIARAKALKKAKVKNK